MIDSSVFRLLAAGLFAVILSLAWTTSGEAHAGSGASASRTSASVAGESGAAEAQSDVAAAAALDASDCSGRGSSGEGGPCCSNVCHAAMSQDLAVVADLATATTTAPSLPEPTALTGPTAHIKRPPRSPAATVG